VTAAVVWDDTYSYLKALWGYCGGQFPLRLCRASRPFVPMIDAGRIVDGPAEVLFVSAVLDCGHVVRVPLERAYTRSVLASLYAEGLRPGAEAARPGTSGKTRRLLPCYKCWMAAGNYLHQGCSFCGQAHPTSLPCARAAAI